MPVASLPEGVTFTITSMEIVNAPRERENGDIGIAFFDLSLGFMEIWNCRLVLEKRGYCRVEFPKHAFNGEERSLYWRAGLKPILDKAIPVYTAMGGEHAPAIINNVRKAEQEV
ncbi:hypothetical protein GB928_018765 [Shinella curvata]|uniref:Uncharacterized protein n=1 Tax=Shinella curvata TaxID=1817964 RepID=A0ABT8XHP8_9HYPH|nr:hypothetical protein [Shinella curvata]MCJ8053903.1 hypothetical protein [Shinella curvata]MDO6123235.1 hypothetical protein [Shinella curvata]